jgi:hypothetical protein
MENDYLVTAIKAIIACGIALFIALVLASNLNEIQKCKCQMDQQDKQR